MLDIGGLMELVEVWIMCNEEMLQFTQMAEDSLVIIFKCYMKYSII